MHIFIEEARINYRDIVYACGILKSGGVIAYPTDTTYGLGCNIFDKGALARIYRIKGQKPGKPMSFILAGVENISEYAHVSNMAFRIIKRIFPGPYTLILEATKKVPRILQTRQRTVGIRIPENTICSALVRELGNPIISTTAIPDSTDLYISVQDISAKYGNDIDLIIDSGMLANEVSTIISLVNNEIKILRKGKNFDNLRIKD